MDKAEATLRITGIYSPNIGVVQVEVEGSPQCRFAGNEIQDEDPPKAQMLVLGPAEKSVP